MHRPSFVVTTVAAAALVGVTLSACDTNDGRQMREPTSSQRAAVPTTTSSTLPGVPITVAPADLLTTTTPLPTSSTSAPAVLESATGEFTVTGPWVSGDAIPADQTCDGTDTAPLIAWTAPPAGTVELALIVTDADAENFVHYAVAGLPPTDGGLGGAAVPGAIEGTNDFGRAGWSGPCPPEGTTHTYIWTVYALAEPSGFVEGGSGRTLWEQLVETSAFASSEFTGVYTRRD